MDVSGWDFRKDGSLPLNGHWDFYWHQLVEPSVLAQGTMGQRQRTKVPGAWNNLPHPTKTGTTLGAHGYGTYVLRIKGMADHDIGQWGLALPPVATSYRVYWLVDGEPISAEPVFEMGKVDRIKPIPKWAPQVTKLPITNGDVWLIIQVVNQHFSQGGIFYPSFYLGDFQELDFWFQSLAFLSILILGIIVMMGLYHFGLFAVRPQDRASLIFALFCVVMFVQVFSYRHWLTLLIFSEVTELNFLIGVQAMNFSAYLALPFLAMFMREVFGAEVPRGFVILTWVVGISICVLFSMMRFTAETGFGTTFFLVNLIEAMILVLFLVRARKAGRDGATLVLVGFLFLFVAAVYDMLIAQEFIEGSLIMTPIGLVFFIIAQGLLVSRRFASAFQQAEHLSQHLQEEVSFRTEALELKTLEAMEATNEAVSAQEEALLSKQDAFRAYRELEIANFQLRELDSQKTAFFQNVSHELRTPLTLILNPLENLLREDTENRDLGMAVRNARRLLRLVNQLLDFQKLEAGKKEFVLRPISVMAFLKVLDGYFGPACKAKGIDFDVTLPKDECLGMFAEADAIEKIAFNFLSNALKFTAVGGTVGILVSPSDSRVRISISDTGPGIRAQDREIIFETFAQLENSRDLSYDGSGLGLALAKELVLKMGGRVGVDSVLEEGSTFWFELPRTTIVDNEIEREPLLSGAASWGQVLPQEETNAAIYQPDDLSEVVEGTPIIAIVDDLQDMRSLLASTLRRFGCVVREFSSGDEALKALRSNPFDLVVTDWMMREMSGPELISAIRDDDALSGLPIVLLTAKSDGESRILGTVAGADVFVGKPFSEDELLSSVQNLLTLKRNEKALQKAYQELSQSSARELRHMNHLVAQAESLASLGQFMSAVGTELGCPSQLVDLSVDEQTDLLDQHEGLLMGAVNEKAQLTSLLENLDEMREKVNYAKGASSRLKELIWGLRTQSSSKMVSV